MERTKFPKYVVVHYGKPPQMERSDPFNNNYIIANMRIHEGNLHTLIIVFK